MTSVKTLHLRLWEGWLIPVVKTSTKSCKTSFVICLQSSTKKLNFRFVVEGKLTFPCVEPTLRKFETDLGVEMCFNLVTFHSQH